MEKNNHRKKLVIFLTSLKVRVPRLLMKKRKDGNTKIKEKIQKLNCGQTLLRQ